MSKQRRTFSAEFKREAAALVLDQGYSHIDACRSLGVVDSALRRWVKQLEAERQGVTPKSKALTDAPLQLDQAASIQRRATACGGRRKTQPTVRDGLTTTQPI
nr:transposase [Pseudomonas aeruginosa]